MDNLEVMLAIETSKREALLQQSRDNPHAQSLLSQVLVYLNLFADAHSESAEADLQARDRLIVATTRLDLFLKGELYRSIETAVNELPRPLTSEQLREVVQRVLDAPPVPGLRTYPEYWDALKKAQEAAREAAWRYVVRDAETQAAQQWMNTLLPLVRHSADLVASWGAGVEERVEQAWKFKQLPPEVPRPYTHTVGAWWAVEQAQQETQRFNSSAELMIQTERERIAAARERIAAAAKLRLAAESEVRSAMTAVHEAAAHLQVAERQVLLRLARLVRGGEVDDARPTGGDHGPAETGQMEDR